MDIYQERIKPLFLESGLQDKEIEEALDLPRGVIYKWGTGKYKSYRNYIAKIASYFHVSTDYLLGKTENRVPTGKEEKPTPVSEGGLSEQEKEVIQLLRLVPPERQPELLEFFRSSLKIAGLL